MSAAAPRIVSAVASLVWTRMGSSHRCVAVDFVASLMSMKHAPSAVVFLVWTRKGSSHRSVAVDFVASLMNMNHAPAPALLAAYMLSFVCLTSAWRSALLLFSPSLDSNLPSRHNQDSIPRVQR